MPQKSYLLMTDLEIRTEVKRIVSECSSDDEIHAKLKDELGITNVALCSEDIIYGDLIRKDGAMVIMSFRNRRGQILDL